MSYAITERPRILYAEDDEDAGRLMSVLLGYAGIDVLCVRTIEAALKEAGRTQFDAYVLDSNFPDGCGLLLCRKLLKLNPLVPVVFYTGNARVGSKNVGLAAGASEYLVKPGFDEIAQSIFRLSTDLAKGVRLGHLWRSAFIPEFADAELEREVFA